MAQTVLLRHLLTPSCLVGLLTRLGKMTMTTLHHIAGSPLQLRQQCDVNW